MLLAPSTIILIIAIVLRRTRKKLAKQFLLAGVCFLIFPIIFIVGHFASQNSEMARRAGVYIVVRQGTINGSCAGLKFDSLQLTLYKNGKFAFNYRPCFTDKLSGNWKWTDNMVHSYSRFDKLNDSFELDIPSEFEVDTVVLTNYSHRYLTFAKLK